jgi:hypothetical protein
MLQKYDSIGTASEFLESGSSFTGQLAKLDAGAVATSEEQFKNDESLSPFAETLGLSARLNSSSETDSVHFCDNAMNYLSLDQTNWS